MANKLYEESHIQAIAAAIREKNGTQNTYLVSEMGEAIRAIVGSSESTPDEDLVIVNSGVCGESVHWNLYDNGLLYISGQGDMYDYNSDDENNSPFYENQNVNKVIINSGVTNIGDDAFYLCRNIESVTIPIGVTSIGWYSFGECSGLTSISLPNGLTTVNEYAFYNCGGLKSVVIPKSVIKICGVAFGNCNSLSTVYYMGSKNEWESIIVEYNNEPLLASDICYNYEPPNNPSQGTNIDLQEKTITENGEYLPDDGYDGFSKVTVDVNVPSDEVLMSFVDGSITDFTIPSTLISVRDGLFYGCTNLATVTIPDSIQRIGRSAFYLCESLESITIPSSVTYIDAYAFGQCTGITEYDFTSWATVPTLSNTNAFTGISSNCVMKVPSALYSKMTTATNWSTYKNYMVAV